MKSRRKPAVTLERPSPDAEEAQPTAEDLILAIGQALEKRSKTNDVEVPAGRKAVTIGMVAGALTALFGGGGVAYLSFQRNLITRPEVEAIVKASEDKTAKSGPYVEERKLIIDRLDRMALDMQRLTDAVGKVGETQAELRGELKADRDRDRDRDGYRGTEGKGDRTGR
jgi:hypothetical protein